MTKTKSGSYHVVTNNGGWAVARTVGKDSDGVNIISVRNIYPTQKEAIKVGRELATASKVNLIVHKRDGSINRIENFGREVYLPKGVSPARRALIEKAVNQTVGKFYNQMTGK